MIYKYIVRNRRTSKAIEVTITDNDTVARYGKAEEPSTMYVKDLVCRRELFCWSEYTDLTVKRV